ncbi:LysM peptidoglycan-binding domain-containing M23 family metallopeptidase [Methylocystis sp. MJC1]|jgi:murein DD-endopeptidase MepM/ murein hydrolase activator NlpD|uniref:LysM peptidoglycan-binding domain-containing M23 family metallopeptidase n=1 Tax=Methylocystis sp. MJC1 TaxID=2654282 RepID=UPI001FEF8744|nr:LysM peptidoglycan-binding domain-containing M23 family metallopeptidase [Methylocystis sp. MJC1]KAF2992843.1 Murein hydrolase activator NlpD [Methylocystis sp. MJC1]UZX13236.1 LysM peptidoglycan-binding domain-containing M23 family metallopeptidase [Methylocystis sp. MJC1]
MAIKRQISNSRVALRLMMAAGAAALMSGCSDATRFSDPFSDPFGGSGSSAAAQRSAAVRGVDRSPTGAIANPAPARVESRPLAPPTAATAPNAAAAAPRTPVAAAAPASAGPAQAHWTADGGTPITVAPSETAAMLATRYGVPADALLHTNGYNNAAQVQPGARLIIPVYRAGAVARSTAPAAAPAPAPAPAKVAAAEPKVDPKAEAAAARAEQRKAEAAAKVAREEQAKAERAAKVAREDEAKAKKAEATARELDAKRLKKAEAEKAAEGARLAKIDAEKAVAEKAAETKKLAEVKKLEAKKQAEAKAAEAKVAAEKAKLAKAEASKSKADAVAKAEAAKAAAEAKLAKAEADKAAKAERLAKAAAEREQPKVAMAERSVEPAPAGKQVDRGTTASIPSAEETTKVAATEGDRPEFRWPARGRIIQGFSSGGNDGINIAVPEGTPVKAAEGGQVAYAGSELKGYGNLVLIRHPNGFVTAYAHNGELEVKRGETVKRGQTIARSGQSGNVGSPQLHFELRKGSTPVDPTNYLAGL